LFEFTFLGAKNVLTQEINLVFREIESLTSLTDITRVKLTNLV